MQTPTYRGDAYYQNLPPPHANQNQWQTTQSLNMPVPQPYTAARTWFRISKHEVRNLTTDQQVLTISSKSSHGMPKGLSSNPCVTITRPDGSLFGTIRFHSISTSDIEYTLNGYSSKLSNSALMKPKYGFKPICRGAVTTSGSSGEKWYWKVEGGTAVVLEDAKKGGRTLATLKADGSLVFEQAGLSNAEYDEILLTGVAVAEKGRRDKNRESISGAIEGLGGLLGG